MLLQWVVINARGWLDEWIINGWIELTMDVLPHGSYRGSKASVKKKFLLSHYPRSSSATLITSLKEPSGQTLSISSFTSTAYRTPNQYKLKPHKVKQKANAAKDHLGDFLAVSSWFSSPDICYCLSYGTAFYSLGQRSYSSRAATIFIFK